jgi:hypothetical protein
MAGISALGEHTTEFLNQISNPAEPNGLAGAND